MWAQQSLPPVLAVGCGRAGAVFTQCLGPLLSLEDLLLEVVALEPIAPNTEPLPQAVACAGGAGAVGRRLGGVQESGQSGGVPEGQREAAAVGPSAGPNAPVTVSSSSGPLHPR